MKLKEKDRRPKHQFEPGDIVELHGSVKDLPGRKGLVLQTAPHVKGQGYQECHCVFAGREVDLYRATRKFISAQSRNDEDSVGFIVINTKLVPTGTKAPEAWMKQVTAKEIRTLRFTMILEED
jgi:hypothetical protein